jgi:integrase
MKTVRMTDRWLNHVSVKSGREEYADAIVRGLRLRVSARSKKWSVLTRRNGKQVRVLIGEFSAFGLLAARERANDILSAASTPDFEKTLIRFKSSNTPALESLCRDYIAQMREKGQKSHKEYQRALIESENSFCNFMDARLGKAVCAGDVQSFHVADWLRQIYSGAPSHARHCRAYLHAVFGWAIKAEFDYTTSASQSAYGITVNPVAATPGGAKAKARQRVLTKRELGDFWRLMPEAANSAMVAAIRMNIAMGGLRITEILHSELPWYKKNWIMLPETKNGREHSLPLTEHGKEQFKEAIKYIGLEAVYLFPHQFDAGRPRLITSASRMTKRFVEKHGFEAFQLRDIRRTMKTHLLDGEYVEEREIDIWHNHGQNSDVARKHYSWAEYKNLKVRVASRIDAFLDTVIKPSHKL